jgi:nitrite reductase (NADH) small subunit
MVKKKIVVVGTSGNVPKVASLFHEKTFSLEDGHCLNNNACSSIQTYEVKMEHGKVYLLA